MDLLNAPRALAAFVVYIFKVNWHVNFKTERERKEKGPLLEPMKTIHCPRGRIKITGN